MVEYAFSALTMEIKPGLADFNDKEVSLEILKTLRPFAEGLPKTLQQIPPGNWRVISHSLTRIDRHLVLTLLLSHE